MVKFDENSTGQCLKAEKKHLLKNNPDCVPIPRVTFHYSLGNPLKQNGFQIKGLQFPLKVSYAITAHKIQGQTIPYPHPMVANLSTIFAPGQAYVILSRIQSLSQLHLTSINEKQIKVDPVAYEEALQMKIRSLNIQKNSWQKENSNNVKISSLNIRSLNKHLLDIKADHILQKSDIICLSETHLFPNNNSNHDLDNFLPYHKKIGKGKGVSIYIKKYARACQNF